VIRFVSTALASLWLALAIACASAGAASASADDSRLLPGGVAAHLWLLPKASNRATSKVLSDLRASSVAPRSPASSGGGIDRSSALRQTAQPLRISRPTPQRRQPPSRASSDPLPAS
jgi:hypothetical protein